MAFDPTTAFDVSSVVSEFSPETAFDPTTVQEVPTGKSAKGDLLESAKRASGDIVQAADMILSLPAFVAKVGTKVALDVFNATSPKTFQTVNEAVDEAFSTGALGSAMTPVSSILEALGAKPTTEGTLVKEVFDEFGNVIEKGAKKTERVTGSSEAGEAFKQVVDIGMLAGGHFAAKAFKGKEPPIKEEPTIKEPVGLDVEEFVPKEEIKPTEPTQLELPIEEPVKPMPTEQIEMFPKEETPTIKEPIVKEIPERTIIDDFKENPIVSTVLEKGKGVVKGLDYALGAIETRLSNDSPRLGQRLVNYEQANLANTGSRLQRVDPFLEDIHSFKNRELKIDFDEALLQNDQKLLSDTLNKTSPEVRQSWLETSKTIKELGREAAQVGVLKGLKEDYLFPRIVKDYDGLLNKLGTERSAPIKRAVEDARVKATKEGRILSPIEESIVINKFLRGYGTPKYVTPFSKERSFKTIPDEVKEFYAPPSEALHTYIRSLTTNIEEYKLFGRNLKKNPDGTVNLDNSIGALVRDELNAGKMTDEQIIESAQILKSRFGTGTRGTSGVMQTLKDTVHGSLLGSFETAAIQLADVYPSIAINGVKPTFLALIKKIQGKEEITAKDLGLVNVISEDFVGTKWSTKLVNSIFKMSGLTTLDRIMKDVSLNSSLISKREVVTGSNKSRMNNFIRAYEPRFGSDFPQLIKDLQEGKRTLLTDQLVFNELHNRQPISRSKRSEWHLNNPNVGGMVFTLKSFLMSQADMFRKYVYNEVKNGNKKEGLLMAAKLTGAMYVSNTSLQSIKNYWLYGDLSPDDDSVFQAIAKTMGWSSYISEDLQNAAFGKAAAKTFLSPYDALEPAFKSFKARIDGDPMTRPSQKDIKLIPLVGKKLYSMTPESKQEEMKKQQQRLKEDLGLPNG